MGYWSGVELSSVSRTGRRNRGVRNSVRLTSRSESELRIRVMKRVRMNIKIR